jgi:hypothetical protein
MRLFTTIPAEVERAFADKVIRTNAWLKFHCEITARSRAPLDLLSIVLNIRSQEIAIVLLLIL